MLATLHTTPGVSPLPDATQTRGRSSTLSLSINVSWFCHFESLGSFVVKQPAPESFCVCFDLLKHRWLSSSAGALQQGGVSWSGTSNCPQQTHSFPWACPLQTRAYLRVAHGSELFPGSISPTLTGHVPKMCLNSTCPCMGLNFSPRWAFVRVPRIARHEGCLRNVEKLESCQGALPSSPHLRARTHQLRTTQSIYNLCLQAPQNGTTRPWGAEST